MSNDPTRLERYFAALALEQDSFDDALAAIRAEQAAGSAAACSSCSAWPGRGPAPSRVSAMS